VGVNINLWQESSFVAGYGRVFACAKKAFRPGARRRSGGGLEGKRLSSFFGVAPICTLEDDPLVQLVIAGIAVSGIPGRR